MFVKLLGLIHRPIYEKRIRVLSGLIVPHLQAHDQVLDIGCGSGLLEAAVLRHRNLPPGVRYSGVEKSSRADKPINVIEYKGSNLPFQDAAFDVVILADVLHHEEDEPQLFSEAMRVCKRVIIVKDHKIDGLLGYWRICFLDWAANNPYDVKCLYRYHTRTEWVRMFKDYGLVPAFEKTSINLYPPLFNFVFGRGLQYFAVIEKGTQVT